ncbi:NAD(P)-dependent malic enzyme [Clostridium autoethanogenum]|uniref:NAD-dependent malic enzyme n=2 Tax=Clostridium autoethanogenum TaxID=84023 RepID=A0A3M0T478_9CLOT|nr:malic enzyme-like NAD(P)-binding protein [Clostridium autoethanogenum]AGY76687.1 NAD-dependent malic enzyme [Clostridium autoethanogenum DSM 10061]ALU36842.1 Malate dehydrogenase (oxaloacetate-decarboxylating) (NADP(+)) [Clostridium autoethanogenum DSM 10061]OVY50468.1 NAD-dependent malic enzyme [Clostridium autoethanogenum]RMD04792.1 NAD-dependent malic enzyme [Clostridium autoethanogenum]
MNNLKEEALKFHKEHEGKIALKSKVSVKTREDLGLAYTPGVAEPCLEINRDYNTLYDYTSKGNYVAVVTNGSAVLGLGNIGAAAGLPVMEGKSILFKTFAGVDAFPICVDSKDPDKIVETVKLIESTFGGINLEDIKAPECFEIEDKLKKVCNIPVFHDDQHGTAVVTLAAMINALKIVNKKFEDLKVIINGAGAAGTAIAKLLVSRGVKNIIVCDRKGAISKDRENLSAAKKDLAEVTNPSMIKGALKDVLKEADVFIGVSAPGVITPEMIKTMAKDPLIFAMANPKPEIYPDEAKAAGARVVGTGRSDFPNQINNVLAFPGIFRGALDVRASKINEEMKIAAACAIADIITEKELNEDYVIPDAFDSRIAPKVAYYVAKAAIESGVARRTDITPEMVEEHTKKLVQA